MIPIILFFCLFLISAQDSGEGQRVIDNSFFSINSNSLYRILGYAKEEVGIPSDVYAGKLEDYRPDSIQARDIRQLTTKFFQAFAAEDAVLEDIMKVYVSENEDARVLWTIQSWMPELKALKGIRIGALSSIDNLYTSSTRLMGTVGTTTVRILYVEEANGWKIIDIEGDLRQLQETHVPIPFAPADVNAPLPSY